MSFTSWRRSHGISISQTTTSKTLGVFDSTTETPHTPYESQVRKDGVERELYRAPSKSKKAIQRSKTTESSASLVTVQNLETVQDSRAQRRSEKSANQHIQYNHKNVGPSLRPLLELNDKGWRSIQDKRILSFGANSTPAQRASLDGQLSLVHERLSDAIGKSPDGMDNRVLQGAPMAVLVHALANVSETNGWNADMAANALACLQHIDVLGAIANPFNAGEPPARADGRWFTEQDRGNAWRLAIELESAGATGFEMLKEVMGKAPVVPNAPRPHATVLQQRDALLHTYLKAAREKVKQAQDQERHMIAPDPWSLHRYINTKFNPPGTPATAEPGVRDPALPDPAAGPLPPGTFVPTIGGRILPDGATLLDKALKAVSSHLQQVEAHAANAATAGRQITFDINHGDVREHTPEDRYNTLFKDCNWACANLVRSGYFSEDSKEYQTLLARTEKVRLRWLKRAHDNEEPSDTPLTKWQRMQVKLKHAVRPGTDKSPFKTYNDIVDHSPERLKAGTDASGIADGQSIRQDLIWNLEKAIKWYGRPGATPEDPRTPLCSTTYPVGHPKAGTPAVENDPPAAVIQQMVRLSILHHQYRFNDKTNGIHLQITRHNEGNPLSSYDVERAKERVYEMFVGGKAAQTRATRDAIDRMLARSGAPGGNENVQLSPRRLVEWGSEVGGPEELAPLINRELNNEQVKERAAGAVDGYRTRVGAGTAVPPAPVAAAGTAAPVAAVGTAVPAPPVAAVGTAVPAPPVAAVGTAVPAPPVAAVGTAVPAPPVAAAGTAVPAAPVAPVALAEVPNLLGWNLPQSDRIVTEQLWNEVAAEEDLIPVAAEAPPAAVPPPPGCPQPVWDQFMDGVNRVLAERVEEFRHAGRNLTELSYTEAAELFEDIIRRQKLGHSIEMSDGGLVGFKLSGIQYLLSQWLVGAGAGIGFALEVGASHRKHAYMQVGTGTGGSTLGGGKISAPRAKIGVGVRYAFGFREASEEMPGIAAGVKVTPFDAEVVRKEGFLYRFRRVFSGVDSDDVRNKQLGRLTRKMMDPDNNPTVADGGAWVNPPDPSDQDIVKKIMHEFDDVSAGFLNSKETITRQTVSAGVSFGVGKGMIGSVATGTKAEWTQRKIKWNEKQGSLTEERRVKGNEYKLSLQGFLGQLALKLKDFDLPDSDEMVDGFRIALNDGMAASVDVYRTGKSIRHTWIYHDGGQTYTKGIRSFSQITHKNAISFVDSILQRLDALAHDKAKIFEQPRYYAGGRLIETPEDAYAKHAESDQMIEQERRQLLQLLCTVLKDPKPTEEFREYYEFAPHYQQMINDLETMIKVQENSKSASAADIKDAERQLDRMKSLDEKTIKKHGDYTFSILDNVETVQKERKFHALIQVTSEKFYKATRINNY